MHNMKTLCQDREHNPIHKKAFNVLIKNLKEKNPIWSRTTLNCERSITRTLFMEENSDGDRLNLCRDRKRLKLNTAFILVFTNYTP